MLTDKRLSELRTNMSTVTDGVTAAIQMTIAKIQVASRKEQDDDMKTYLKILDKQVELLDDLLHMEKNLDNDESINNSCPYEDCYD